MYLTTFTLNPGSPEARECLRRPYDMHRTLKRAAPDDPRILFRVNRNAGEVRVVWDRAMPLPDGMAVGVSQYALPAVQNGTLCEFALWANPTRQISRTSKVAGYPGKISGRVFIADPAEQLHWLNRRIAEAGAVLMDARSERRHGIGDRQGAPESDKGVINHVGVEFTGLLQVTDTQRFAHALRNGIGRAKAFGFGLLFITWHSGQQAGSHE